MKLRSDHQCEITARQKDVLFLPGGGPCRRILAGFRHLFMASPQNLDGKRYLRSTASITFEKRRHLRNYRHIIHPFSLFTHYWRIVMIFVLTSVLISLPYQAAFDMNRSNHAWTIVKNVFLAMCFADMLINCMTGYFDKEQHAVQMNQSMIMKRYALRGRFFLDLFGSIPTDGFFIFVWNEYAVAREMASLVCALRVFALSAYIGRVARAYDTPLAVYEFCSIIFWLMIALHWQACLYWLVPIASASMTVIRPPRNDSWVHGTEIWDTDSVRHYQACLLRAVATFFRSGFLRIKPLNAEDVYVVMVMQLLGTCTICILLGRVMQFFKGANSSTLRYQGAVAQLKQYMRHKQLPHSTQKRIMTYYEYRFQHRYFREAEILNTLSAQMRQEIGMHSCRKLVENVTFFNNLPLSLLGRIVSLLKSEIFLTNDVIVRVDQPGNCMYFIASGTVSIYTRSGKEVVHLEDGAHFGEIALVMPDERRVATVVAVETCELYRLDRADFARTIHPYPMLWERIKKIAIERHEKTTILNAQHQ